MAMEKWGRSFEWVVKGAAVEDVWAVTADFVGVDKWMTSLVQSCALVEGERQKPGCVRRPVLYPAAAGKPSTYALEKLLAMDEADHHYTYTILSGTLPGFSLMQDYVSTFRLVPLPLHLHGQQVACTLLHWSFVCSHVASLTETQAQGIAFSLYQTAVDDLRRRLSLPEDAIALLTSAPPPPKLP